MKWGVRRFQNPDGTLTDAGRARYKLNDKGKYVKLNGTNATNDEMAYSKKRLAQEAELELNLSSKAKKAAINIGKGLTSSISIIAKNVFTNTLQNKINKWIEQTQKKEEERKNDEFARSHMNDSNESLRNMSTSQLNIINNRASLENKVSASRTMAIEKEEERRRSSAEEERYYAWLRGREIFNNAENR